VLAEGATAIVMIPARPRRRPAAVVLAAATALAVALVSTGGAGATPTVGADISWPQCGRSFPSGAAFGIVGVSGGKPYEDNPCLVAEYRWAAATGLAPGLYMNTANPGPKSATVSWYGQRSPNASCRPGNEAACSYDYGYGAARHAFQYANARVPAGPGHTWWLDVEIGNSWSDVDLAANLAAVVGSIDYLSAQRVPVGIYSNRYQWTKITGGARIAVPNWAAGARNAGEAAQFCSTRTFSGGPVLLVQYVADGFDHDLACPGADAVLRPAAPPLGGPDLLGGLLRALGLAPKTAP
jgi:hypothetical protein